MDVDQYKLVLVTILHLLYAGFSKTQEIWVIANEPLIDFNSGGVKR